MRVSLICLTLHVTHYAVIARVGGALFQGYLPLCTD